jgi:hypothetical protein
MISTNRLSLWSQLIGQSPQAAQADKYLVCPRGSFETYHLKKIILFCMGEDIQAYPSAELPTYPNQERKSEADLGKDDALLATLGYKAELKREFTALEVFGLAFSIMGLLPSIASTLVYSMPAGGPVGMVLFRYILQISDNRCGVG